MSGIQTEDCSEGTLDVGWIDTGDWMEYAINLGACRYTVEYRVASLNGGGQIAFIVGGNTLDTVTVPNTGGWQNWITIATTISLNTEAQTIRLRAESVGFNINYFNISRQVIPQPPTSIITIAGDTGVYLKWEASFGAASYILGRSTTSGGPYVAIATGVTSVSYVDTGLINNTTYYYVVRAVNSLGTSGNSSQVAATPSNTDQNYLASVTWSSENAPCSGSWFAAPMPIQYRLSNQPSLVITKPGTTATTFNVDPSITYQTMQGIGSSIEETTVYNLRLMTQAKRTEALKLMVDPVNGTGMNLMRLTIGTSDFTGRPWYSYDDMPSGQTDTSLTNFSIQKDIDYGIIQIIKEVQAANPNLRFIASPWSPPAWMKSSENICGGTLKDGMYTVLAQYYRLFIQAYQAQGIPIYAMTLQNEPGHDTGDMPSMGLSYEQEIEMVKAMKAEFQSYGITTKLWIHDHNFDNALSFPANILADSGAYAAADGTAFHDYGGNPSQMSDLHNLYPNKEIFFTERSFWGTGGMDRIAQYIRNWACTYDAWVSMIDQNGKPNNGPFHCDPTFLIKGSDSSDSYWAIPELYLMGQYGKFVQFGAKRIASDYGTGGLTSVAFLNPDGNIVLVVINQNDSDAPFTVRCRGNEFIGMQPAKTVGTYTWKSGLSLSPYSSSQ
jgi:glucosylceramidase